MPQSAGKVYLVGGGPGDIGLLTVRGKELLGRADVVVYDHLINEALLQWAPQAEHVYVGKSPDKHLLTQDDINRVLIDLAGDHGAVLRLKGGDPFVFGRGGEEAVALRAAGVPFEVVPGVTAGIAVPAYAGIPVTLRGVSSSLVFITGHRDSKSGDVGAPIDTLLTDSTIVIFMGLRNLDALSARLIEAGRPPETPAAAIEWGTMNHQRTVTGTLTTLSKLATEAGLASPVLTVIGDVVDARETVSWFESRPLFGRRVAVTQTRERGGELIARLRELGAEVFEFPTIRIESATESDPVPASEYDWIVMTSINSVDALFQALNDSGRDARALHGTSLCAISTRTAMALRHRGIVPDAIPDRYDGTGVVAALEAAAGSLTGTRILIPRADIGQSSIPAALREAGAEVTESRAYATAVPPEASELLDALFTFQPDYITFGSAASVRNFHAILGVEGVTRLGGPVLAAIGPVAAQAARELGLKMGVVPHVHQVPALVDALVEWDRSHRSD